MQDPADDQIKDEQAEDSEEDNGVIEYSPCGRWQKRAEELHQKELSGIDATYLAMDLEEGVEVVWNEIEISMGRDVEQVKDQINNVLLNLVNLTHQYIINFHDHWIDTTRTPPRVIFITEYMSAGSLMAFLKKSQKTVRSSIRTWKRWCGQIICALMFFHESKPNPIIHGNLSCDGIFLQHNGILKVCAVAPGAIYHGVKTSRMSVDKLHYIAPEYASESSVIGTASDIYSFGMCALRLYVYIQGLCNDPNQLSSKEKREKLIESIEKPEIKSMISKCLRDDPSLRPTARDLLLHPSLIEIPPLKFLAIDKHERISNSNLTSPATYYKSLSISAEHVFAVLGSSRHPWLYSQLNKPSFGELIVALRDGKFPLLCSNVFASQTPDDPKAQAVDHNVLQLGESSQTHSTTGGLGDLASQQGSQIEGELSPPTTPIEETRLALSIECSIKQADDASSSYLLSLLIKFADKTNRQLSCEIVSGETGACLTHELLSYFLINEADFENVESAIDSCITQMSASIENVE